MPRPAARGQIRKPAAVATALIEQVFALGMGADTTQMRFNESIYSFLDRAADPARKDGAPDRMHGFAEA
jgi:hypothetical protein